MAPRGLVWSYQSCINRSWRHHISPKRRLFTRALGIICQKTEMLIKLSGDVPVLHFEILVVFAGMSPFRGPLCHNCISATKYVLEIVVICSSMLFHNKHWTNSVECYFYYSTFPGRRWVVMERRCVPSSYWSFPWTWNGFQFLSISHVSPLSVKILIVWNLSGVRIT